MFLGWINGLAAEETVPHHTPVVSTYVVRTGEQLQTPHVLTYELVEYSQQRGRWILPDIGIYGGGQDKDKLLFGGAGAELRLNRRVVLT